MKITINLPDTFTFTKRNGASIDIDPAKLDDSVLADLFTYGLRQKVFDGASGEPTSEGSETAMQSVRDKLYSGDWSARGEAASTDPLDRYRIAIVREIMAKPNNAKIKAAYDAIPSDEQAKRREFLLSVAAKNADAINPVAEKRRKADLAAKQQSADLDLAI